MSKQKSVTARGLRALYVLPLIAAALACNSRSVTNYEVSENPQTKSGEMTVPSMDEVNLFVTQAGNHVEYSVNGEKVSLDAIGEKVLEAQGEGFAYVSIIGDPALRSGVIQQVKDELRKVNFLRIQYVCEPSVSVPRKLERTEAKKTLSDLPEMAGDGDVQIRLNDSDRLLYMRGVKDARAINQEDLFALAREDVEKNPGIKFFFVIDDNSSFGPYSSAVQSVYNAFITAREDMAVKTYGKPFDELEEAQQDELRDKCYVKITEISK
jgi:biopolymer transport protein ExbD